MVGSAPTAAAGGDDARTSRRARIAVSAVFLTNGAVYANLLPRFPEIKADLDLGNAALGAGIAAFPLGALLAGLLAPAVIGRFRTARVASAGLVLLAWALFAVSVAPTWPLLAAAFFVGGGLDSLIDVAQNAHGLRVQRRYRRSVVNSFHGVWSIGAVTGGAMGSLAVGAGVPRPAHMAASGLLFSAVALVSARFLLPGPDGAERDGGGRAAPAAGVASESTGGAPVAAGGSRPAPGPARTGPRPTSPGRGHGAAAVLAALGGIAASGAVVEDAGASWGALYLTDEVGAAAAMAGAAFVALQGAMTVGRLLGDRVVDRFGQRAVARAGGLLTTAGMAGALLVPSVATTIIGFALAGLGVATLVPAAMGSADEVPGLAPGVGLTVISWLLRFGFLATPPVVGLVADSIGLRAGLVVVPLVGLVVIALSPALADRPAAP